MNLSPIWTDTLPARAAVLDHFQYLVSKPGPLSDGNDSTKAEAGTPPSGTPYGSIVSATEDGADRNVDHREGGLVASAERRKFLDVHIRM